jgi:hypothetical protein
MHMVSDQYRCTWCRINTNNVFLVGQATQEAELLKSTPDKATLEAIAEYKKETATRVQGLRKTLSKELLGMDPLVFISSIHVVLSWF